MKATAARRLLAILVFSVVTFTGLSATAHADGESWKLRWADEFDGPAGSLPDPSRWNIETGTHGFGGQELQAYTDRPVNVSLNGLGQLVIRAYRENFLSMGYTSARIHTAKKLEFRYGAIEIRASSPAAQGVGPAGWTSGHGKGLPWPQVCERDIWEVFNAEGKQASSNLICSSKLDENVPVGQGEHYYFPEGEDVTGWHVYRHEYVRAKGGEPEEMRFYVDGKLFRRSKPEWFPGVWNFDKYDHFILLNIAVGGDRAWGMPLSSTPFPQQMVVDYVRFYEEQ